MFIATEDKIVKFETEAIFMTIIQVRYHEIFDARLAWNPDAFHVTVPPTMTRSCMQMVKGVF